MSVAKSTASNIARQVAQLVTLADGGGEPPEPSAPAFTSDPVISGNEWVGQTLTTSNGAGTGYPSPTITYQWNRGGSPISGATSQTYLLVTADDATNITCTVTRTNSEGSDTATSAAVGPIKTAPANTVAPTVTGSPTVDSALTCSTGTWTGSATITYAYQWLADDVAILGATSSTYTPVLGDLGAMIRCEVTASNGTVDATETSNEVGPVTDSSELPFRQALLFDGTNPYDSEGYIADQALDKGTRRLPRPAYVGNFDGATNYASDSISNTGNAFTVSAWVKAGPLAGRTFQHLFALANAGVTHAILFPTRQSSANCPAVAVITPSGTYIASGSFSLTNGVWYHLAATWDGSEIKLFIDGAEVAATSTAGTRSFDAIVIGKNAESNFSTYFTGSSYDLRYYSDAKSGLEIAAIYSGDFGNPNTTNLLGAWALEEESGTSFYDWSGNGNTMTLGGTLTGFREVDAKKWSLVDEQGYSLSGAVVIPRVPGTTDDASGGTSTYTGRAHYLSRSFANTITGNGTDVYANAGDCSISATSVTCFVKQSSDNQPLFTLQNSAATGVSVVAGVLTFGGSLSVSQIKVDGEIVTASDAGVLLNDNGWHKLELTMSAISANNVRLLTTTSSNFMTGSIAGFTLSASGVTKTIVSEGTGQRVWIMGDDDSATEVATAIQGTLTSVHGMEALATEDWFLRYGGRLSAGRYIPAKTDGTGADGVTPTSTVAELLEGRKLDFRGGVNSAFAQLIALESAYTYGDARSSVAPTDTKRKFVATGIEKNFAADDSAIPDSADFTD